MTLTVIDVVSVTASNEGEFAGRYRRAIFGRDSTNTAAASDDKCVVVRPDGTVIVVPCGKLLDVLSVAGQ